MILKKKKRDPGAGLPPPRGNTHVYPHNIERYSLKRLKKSRPNFIKASIGRGNQYVHK